MFILSHFVVTLLFLFFDSPFGISASHTIALCAVDLSRSPQPSKIGEVVAKSTGRVNYLVLAQGHLAYYAHKDDVGTKMALGNCNALNDIRLMIVIAIVCVGVFNAPTIR